MNFPETIANIILSYLPVIFSVVVTKINDQDDGYEVMDGYTQQEGNATCFVSLLFSI